MRLANQIKKIKKTINRRRLSTKLMGISPNLALHISPIKSIAIEASSACNIRCLCCPVGNKAVEGRNMSPGDFANILDLLPPHIKLLSFSHRGDPTMNPRFPEIVNLAFKRGLETDIYTNGLTLDKYITDLVESGLTSIRIDLDGASEHSYLNYRIGSNFERVKSNVRLLVEARSKSKEKFPKKIRIMCVVTAFNENEIPEIQSMAESLGVDEVLFKTAITNYGTKFYRDISLQKGIAPANKAYRRAKRPKNFICPALWRGAILYNGDLQICTADFEGEYVIGNILREKSFEKVFYGKKARSIREQIIKQNAPLCKTCAVIDKDHFMKGINRKFAH